MFRRKKFQGVRVFFEGLIEAVFSFFLFGSLCFAG